MRIVRAVGALRALLGFGLATAVSLAMAAPASAGCLKDEREVQFKDGSARLRSYLCETAPGGPRVRVEFHRLSEAAAGSILMGSPYPEVEQTLGKLEVLSNPVAANAKAIFEEFGTRQRHVTCFKFDLEAPAGGVNYSTQNARGETDQSQCLEREIWYLGIPDLAGYTWHFVPLPRDVLQIQKKLDWPAGYAFTFGDCSEGDIIACSKIWRYLRRDDLDNYIANTRLWERAIEKTDSPREEEYILGEDDKKYYALIRKLTKGGWPEDLMVAVGAPVGCGGFGFNFHLRQMITDIATIENVSAQPVTLDGILGDVDLNENLRTKPRALPQAISDQLHELKATIPAGGKVAVALRTTFVNAASMEEDIGKPADVQAAYQRVRSTPPGTIFVEKGEFKKGDPRIRKTRESYGPPSRPRNTSYVYGPDVALRGLSLGGARVDLEETSANFMEVTAGDGYGSCPYLYGFDAGRKEWINYGKIIHEFNTREKKATQTVPLARPMTRFRIAEEELELSHIDQASLRLDMQDGTAIVLKPDLAALAETDERAVSLYADQAVEFAFDYPDWLEPAHIGRASLVVTGYYQPYSTIPLSQNVDWAD